MVSAIELIIPILLVTMVVTGLVALILRRKIKNMLRISNEFVFNLYFKQSGIFDANIKSSSKIAKFFVSPNMWNEVTEKETLNLLNTNRKIEITYYSSFIGVIALFVLSLILMVLNTDYQ